MEDLGMGAVGLGRLGYVHAQNIARSVPRAKLIAVCDMQEELAKAAAEELGCTYYTDIHYMLENQNIDAVCVATPTAYHVDPVIAVTEAKKPLSGIFAFPKGTKAGTFLHDLLEHLDFTFKDTTLLQGLVLEKLRQHGFEAIWLDTILNMVQKVLSVPLKPDRKDFSLSRVPNGDRLNELEFYFPLKLVTPADLGKIGMKTGQPQVPGGAPEQMGRLEFAPVRGYMKGFMDLVFRFEDRFYLVDWKSNFLGGKVEDYDEPGMAVAMAESFYTLQYHLYTLALHRYLKVKQRGYDYDRHFGGVYYIFLRGVDPDKGPQFGVFRDRPPQALIEELCETLIED